jgi:hypothetical protein
LPGKCISGVSSNCTAALPSLCNGVCTNVTTDAANCGGCGNMCPSGQACVSGQCAGIICVNPNTPEVCNNDQCTNQDSDPSNCSACGDPCPNSGNCVLGQCDTCAAGSLVCNGICIDGTSDDNNCGGCNTKCINGQTCQAGSCAGVVCNDPNTPNLCNGDECVNVLSNSANCGSCGNPCAAPMTCQQGKCAPPPAILCPDGAAPDQCGSPPFCTNLQTNRLTCGDCFTKCPSNDDCFEGRCVTGPVCDGVPSDVFTDPNNCNGCGNKCPVGSICQNALCQPGPMLCGNPNTPNACNNDCVNFQTDPSNCGVCDNACSNGDLCNEGTCAPVPTASPTPAFPNIAGTYFLSGVATGAVTGVPDYIVAASANLQVVLVAAPIAYNISGSVTVVDLTNPPTGFPDFAGSYSCNSGFFVTGQLFARCTRVLPDLERYVVDFEGQGSCITYTGGSCSGTIGLYTSNGFLGWGGGPASVTP